MIDKNMLNDCFFKLICHFNSLSLKKRDNYGLKTYIYKFFVQKNKNIQLKTILIQSLHLKLFQNDKKMVILKYFTLLDFILLNSGSHINMLKENTITFFMVLISQHTTRH